jgi:hypothetical protein
VVVLVCGCLAGLFLLPLLVAAVMAGEVQQAAQAANDWDVPADVTPALQAAGQSAGIPWFLLAGIASVATDFARHAPDGLSRGDIPGTALFPVVTPAILVAGGGAGMFLLDGRQATPPLDAQAVGAAATWLADRLAVLAHGDTRALGSLTDAAVGRFWQDLLPAAPILITTTAPNATDGAGSTPVSPGDNPIRQFAAAVMARIGAPGTAANLDAFAAWAAGEGTCARFNPLATTQPEPGAAPFNNLSGGGHVWNYPTFDIGVQATTTAMTNGLYQPVLAAFRASAGVAAVAAAVERSPWGTRFFGSPSYAGRSCGGGGVGGGPAVPPAPLPTATGPSAVAATIVARAAQYELAWAQMTAAAPTG